MESEKKFNVELTETEIRLIGCVGYVSTIMLSNADALDAISDSYKRSICARCLLQIVENLDSWQNFVEKMKKLSTENDI
jgi:hypothetical protein